jgi:lipoate-protein ligase A
VVDTIGRALIGALAAADRTVVDLDEGDPQARVNGDRVLLEHRLGEPAATPLLRIWTNGRCIVASAAQSHLGSFAAAAAASAARGWPVVSRLSGGTAVAHRPGVLNVSLFADIVGPVVLEDTYLQLVTRLATAVEQLGVSCDHGTVAASYCDGRYNLRSGGRKLAGLAASVRRRGARVAYVSHASIALSGDLAADLTAIEAFETSLGRARPYDLAAHTTLTELLGAD